jgi:hypothetical protein
MSPPRRMPNVSVTKPAASVLRNQNRIYVAEHTLAIRCEDGHQGRDSMGNPNDSGKEKRRSPFEKPTVTKMTPEEAKLKLLDLAKKGDNGAKEMLEMMLPEDAKKLSSRKKPA